MAETQPILRSADVLAARSLARRLAREAGFGTVDQTRLATAISELARNVLQHGGGKGTCRAWVERTDGVVRVRCEVQDSGPGIPNVELALTDGYSTGPGLGAGLPAARRLVNEFAVESRPGRTVVRIALVQRRPGG